MKTRFKVGGILAGLVVLATLAYGANEKGLFTGIHKTLDAAKRPLTLAAGETLINPELDSGANDYVVNGTLVTTGTNSGTGTFTGTGTIRSMAPGEDGTEAVFQDVRIEGTLTGGSPVDIEGGLTVAGGATISDGLTITGNVGYDAIGFRAHKTVASAVFNSDAGFISTYDTTDFINGGTLTNSGSRFTASVKGVYRVSALAWFNCSRALTSADSLQMFFLKNGTAISRSRRVLAGSDAQRRMESSNVVLLNGTTDYVELQITANNGGAAFTCTDFSDGGQPYSYLSATYVGDY